MPANQDQHGRRARQPEGQWSFTTCCCIGAFVVLAIASVIVHQYMNLTRMQVEVQAMKDTLKIMQTELREHEDGEKVMEFDASFELHVDEDEGKQENVINENMFNALKFREFSRQKRDIDAELEKPREPRHRIRHGRSHSQKLAKYCMHFAIDEEAALQAQGMIVFRLFFF